MLVSRFIRHGSSGMNSRPFRPIAPCPAPRPLAAGNGAMGRFATAGRSDYARRSGLRQGGVSNRGQARAELRTSMDAAPAQMSHVRHDLVAWPETPKTTKPAKLLA